MLAPYVNPVLHPYTEEEIAALEDAETSKDIANVYRFLKTIQADGFNPNQDFYLRPTGREVFPYPIPRIGWWR